PRKCALLRAVGAGKPCAVRPRRLHNGEARKRRHWGVGGPWRLHLCRCVPIFQLPAHHPSRRARLRPASQCDRLTLGRCHVAPRTHRRGIVLNKSLTNWTAPAFVLYAPYQAVGKRTCLGACRCSTIDLHPASWRRSCSGSRLPVAIRLGSRSLHLQELPPEPLLSNASTAC